MNLEEANRLIPELDRRLASIIEKREKYALHHDHLFMEELLTQAERHRGIPVPVNGTEDGFRGLEASLDDLETEMEELRRLGAVVRSFDPLTVDILGSWDGETVYYCWRRGEDRIRRFRMLTGTANEVFALPEA